MAPLHYATSGKFKKIVELLLSHPNIKINLKNNAQSYI